LLLGEEKQNLLFLETVVMHDLSQDLLPAMLPKASRGDVRLTKRRNSNLENDLALEEAASFLAVCAAEVLMYPFFAYDFRVF
jgi:hypothetical protein